MAPIQGKEMEDFRFISQKISQNTFFSLFLRNHYFSTFLALILRTTLLYGLLFARVVTEMVVVTIMTRVARYLLFLLKRFPCRSNNNFSRSNCNSSVTRYSKFHFLENRTRIVDLPFNDKSKQLLIRRTLAQLSTVRFI